MEFLIAYLAKAAILTRQGNTIALSIYVRSYSMIGNFLDGENCKPHL